MNNLKQVEAGYPPDLFTMRRQGYLQHLTEVASGAGAAAGVKPSLTTGKGGGAASMVGGILETGLAVILLAETFTAAVLYWDEIFDFVRALSSNW
ncbi:MAG: hypothetical protein IT313_11015 [Anaerolineales bacterium]|nr:hypothetical protein [Anaerolineales bacterium]